MSGSVHWAGRDLDEHDLAPNEIGYVPQFGIAFDLLTVGESVETALRLRVGGLDAEERAARTPAFPRASRAGGNRGPARRVALRRTKAAARARAGDGERAACCCSATK